MDTLILETIKKYLNQAAGTLKILPTDKIARVVEILAKARDEGRHVYIFGNGGSAATASHFACDLNKGAISKVKRRMKALALVDNIPVLSAWANDTDYSRIFSEQLENLVEPGDVAIAISGSGNSANVLSGARTARSKGALVIGLLGFGGGKLKELVHIAIIVPGDSMEQAEDMHLVLEHTITICLRQS
jgi:D-sedoheptulose 7-phosphate isomerase